MFHRSIRSAWALALVLGLSGAACAARAADSVPAATAVLTAEQFKAFEGEFALAPNFSITVFQQDGKFMTQGSGQPAFEIFADSPDTFFAKVAPIKIGFTKDAAGKVTHLNLTQGGRTLPPAPRSK